jgi:DinB family protein
VRLGCRSVSRPTANDRAISPIAAWHSLVLAIGARLDLSSVGPLGHHHGMTDVATDPILSPEGYRRMLLDYLGEDDPAIAQAATVSRLRELVAEAGDDLRTRPESTEWSVIECIGHLTDSELVTAGRVRWILSEDEPQIIGYDQDLWVDGLHHDRDDPDALIAFFDALRSANLRLLATRPTTDLERIGRHNERGPESYGLMIRLTAGHDRFHVAQAERALAAVRGAR